jgi:hypothetical protein
MPLVLGVVAMAPLEQLFALEVEFQRRVRTEALGSADAGPAHISYALQCGYERFLYAIGRATAADVARLVHRFNVFSDTRDVLAARDSLEQILGIRAFDE